MNREEEEKELAEIFHYYSQVKDSGSQDNLVTMLREIQEIHGCISPDLQQKAADTAGVKLSSVICIMKLYKSLKAADYSHKILVCTGPVCGRKNISHLELIKKELGIGKEGLSADGKVLLQTGGCLKNCSTAPNIMIDGILHTHVTEKELQKLIQNLS